MPARMRKLEVGGTLSLLLFGLLTAHSLFGQMRQSSPSAIQRADVQLNQTYQQLMTTLPLSTKEQLRNVERAWVDFMAKNNAAIRAAAPRLGISPSGCEDLEADEISDRISQLVSIGRPAKDNIPESAQREAVARFARLDEELNVIYQRCLDGLSPADTQKLREAQRAWIVFRDANRPFSKPWELCVMTGNRLQKLQDFYIGSKKPSLQYTAGKADRTVPDPFERAR